VVGSSGPATALAFELRRRGLFVPAIRPPTVPEGEACLRIGLTWLHTDAMIDALVEAMASLRG
jgi:8-amino-7-oxononanoate synthase